MRIRIAGAVALAAAAVASLAEPAEALEDRGSRSASSSSRCVTGWEFEGLWGDKTRAEVEGLLDWEGREGVRPAVREYRKCGRSWAGARVIVGYRAGRLDGAILVILDAGRFE